MAEWVVAFDTCGPVIGVAGATASRVVVRAARVRRGAEARLVPWVAEVMHELGVTMTDLSGVGAAVGPGAFTGLRVGLAAATGLALARGVPLWGTGSLEHRRLAAGSDEPMLVLLDARKQRVYAGAWRDGAWVHGAADVPPEEAATWLAPPFRATGEGASVYRELLVGAGAVIEDDPCDPGLGALAEATRAAIAAGEGTSPANVRPVYLRPPDAKPPRKGRIGGR